MLAGTCVADMQIIRGVLGARVCREARGMRCEYLGRERGTEHARAGEICERQSKSKREKARESVSERTREQ